MFVGLGGDRASLSGQVGELVLDGCDLSAEQGLVELGDLVGDRAAVLRGDVVWMVAKEASGGGFGGVIFLGGFGAGAGFADQFLLGYKQIG